MGCGVIRLIFEGRYAATMRISEIGMIISANGKLQAGELQTSIFSADDMPLMIRIKPVSAMIANKPL
jgi:hypothetical protein